MSVKIRLKQLAGNKISLLLDIYHQGSRSRETLNLYLFKRPRTEQEKLHNKEANAQAESARSKKELELSASGYNLTPAFKHRTNLMLYFEQYAKNYNRKNKRAVLSCYAHFKVFVGKNSLFPRELTENLCLKFRDYLDEHLHGETPYDYFMHFKRMLKQALRDEVLIQNPAVNVTNRKTEGPLKDVLTMEEIQTLASTPCNSAEVKRAFLFACCTGLRGVDIRALKGSHIRNGVLTMTQSKTQKSVIINLNVTAQQLLGKAVAPEQLVFQLPTQNGVNKTLKAWAKRAKIDKHVTFHVARHSFGTNLLIHGGDVVSVSSLLGHNSLKYTQRYVRAVAAMKETAVNNLPILKLL